MGGEDGVKFQALKTKCLDRSCNPSVPWCRSGRQDVLKLWEVPAAELQKPRGGGGGGSPLASTASGSVGVARRLAAEGRARIGSG